MNYIDIKISQNAISILERSDFWEDIITGVWHSPEIKSVEIWDGGKSTKENALQNDYVKCENTGKYHYINDCFFCSLEGVYFSHVSGENEYEFFDGDTTNVISETAKENGDFKICYYRETLIYASHARYCVDVCEYVHENYAYFHYETGDYYYDKDNFPSYCDDPECIQEYGEGNDPEKLRNSRYYIGFEIEKNNFFGCSGIGEHIGYFELFAAFETDSSCGVEAITHILPLVSSESDDYNYVISLFEDSEDILSSEYNEDCGGHINVSFCPSEIGITPKELYERLSCYIGIFYALYRYRLKNGFCSFDPRMIGGGRRKYSPVFVKRNCVEIRIPGAVKSLKNLLFRYDLTYQIMYSIENNISFSQTFENCEPILRKVYKTDEEFNKIKSLAYQFQKFVEIGETYPEINEFIEKYDPEELTNN